MRPPGVLLINAIHLFLEGVFLVLNIAAVGLRHSHTFPSILRQDVSLVQRVPACLSALHPLPHVPLVVHLMQPRLILRHAPIAHRLIGWVGLVTLLMGALVDGFYYAPSVGPFAGVQFGVDFIALKVHLK